MLDALYAWYLHLVPIYRTSDDAGFWLLRSQRELMAAYLESWILAPNTER